MIGTTPTHFFNIGVDASEAKEIEIVYAQEDEIILTKNKADCELTGSKATVKLTQEETFKFDQEKKVQIQARTLTTSGKVIKSFIKLIEPYKCLSKEVL